MLWADVEHWGVGVCMGTVNSMQMVRLSFIDSMLDVVTRCVIVISFLCGTVVAEVLCKVVFVWGKCISNGTIEHIDIASSA